MMLRDARRNNRMALSAGVAAMAVSVTIITALLRGAVTLTAFVVRAIFKRRK
ncbi:hypothetical protein [Rhodobacter sp. 24-YEA-8]|uniref:hypothetical protein n=1 Tax=Rhodobacter sp. 24-YEA-8 TaxID=1884310 RepID=UPI00089BD778|nr:hypothetical protein [Rhodobacter sp. 24-YEA-8]SEC14238.1 hypothetical protein SAMN05519105_2030 [Rhodobacter sp. 24-YEA-8]